MALGVIGLLLLAEPDMGAFMVIAVIAMGILFLGGVNGRMFFLSIGVLVGAFVLMIVSSPWRAERILAFLNPWDPKYAQGKGYQLTHSLIALGRGEVFGQGLGGSVEKLHYLPEAHTDFMLAVIGEELGFVGVACVIFAFFWISRRLFHVGRQAIALDRVFAGLYAQGIGIWMGGQAFINMGVNLGLLADQGADAAADELRRLGDRDEHRGAGDRAADRHRESSVDAWRPGMTRAQRRAAPWATKRPTSWTSRARIPSGDRPTYSSAQGLS